MIGANKQNKKEIYIYVYIRIHAEWENTEEDSKNNDNSRTD